MTQKRYYWLLTGIAGLAFALRVIGLDSQSLWRDEVDAILFAAKPLSRLLHNFVEPGQNGPLYYLLLRPWLSVAGRSEFALRFWSAICGVLTVPLIYRLGRRLFPILPAAGLLAALLAATSPYLVWYGREGKMYALVSLLILLSMDRYLAALEMGGWRRWLSYVLATSAAFYVHLISALVVPAQLFIFLLIGRRDGYRRWKGWLGSIAMLTVPYVPLLVWQVPQLQERVETGYRFVPLHEILASLLANYSLGVAQGATGWHLIPFVGALLAAGLLLASRGRWRGSLWLLACWLLIPVVSFFFVTLIRPLYTARYLIFVVPAYLLLMAFVVVDMVRRSRLAASLLLLSILVVNGWGVWLQARIPLKTDFRSATRYIACQLGVHDLVLFQIPHGRYSFDYYFEPCQRGYALSEGGHRYRVFLPTVSGGSGNAYRWAEGLYTNAGMSLGEADRRMMEITRDSRVVWLVATEVPMWDERNLVQGWLDKHALLTEEARFVRVTVYRYELP